MKHFSTITICFFITLITFAQQNTKENFKPVYPQLLPHDIKAEWPSKSFYQRKGEWQHIIDSTWGPGIDVSAKKEVYTKCVNLLENRYALFHRLEYDWDSLKTYWWNQITDSTSKGGFSAILGHLVFALKDGHTKAFDKDIGVTLPGKPLTKLNPGIPILVFDQGGILDASHFGAVLTTNDNKEIFVIRSADSHPLGLEPGDVILGYEGVKWMDLVDELLNAHLPIIGGLPTTKDARIHKILANAGINWHLFSTIDIVKYSTGDTLHLSLEHMVEFETDRMTYSEQLDIPGVPKPKYLTANEQVSYGKIENTNMGYIYIYGHEDTVYAPISTNDQFYEAVNNLYDTDGLIIDLRFENGGDGWQNLNEGLDLLLNMPTDVLRMVVRCDESNLFSLCDTSAALFNTYKLNPNPNTFYEKPIAVLVGPLCASAGDLTAARLTSLPNAKFFGKTTAGLFGAIAELDINGCYFRCQIQDSYYTNDPYEYLSGTEFPVDEKVWLTKDDVALGEDKVVKEALNWINNLANSHNAKIDKTYSNDEVTFTADVLNPNGQELSIIANIKNDSLIVESLNCEIKNGKINETIDISAYPEDLYSVTIKTENQFDYNIHTLPNIVRFTNAGPVKIDTFKASFNDSLVLISDLYLRNLGTSKELKNIRLDLLSIDSTVSRITTSYTTYNNISPGETGKSKTFLKYYTKDVSDTNNFIVEIAIDKVKYWEDTLIVIPPKPSDIALLDKLPTEYSLEQNYPNPFNPSTVIKYSIPANSVIARSDATWQSAEITSGNSFPRNDNVNVSLKVYDILGREIATLVNQKQKPGFYEVKLDGSDLSSGIYFYRITAGDYVESKKMVLLK